MPNRFFRISALAALYVSQALPLGFFVIALPAILRTGGFPLEKLGLLSALALPWLIKFLWAPLVDRFGARRSHYRSWILPLQLGCVVVVAWIASLDLSLDIDRLVIAGALFMLLSATQDIATDGLAVRILAPSERGLGNGVQVAGYYLGQVLGGGGVLILYGRFGWTPAIGAMAVVLAVPMLWMSRLQEPDDPPTARGRVGFADLGRFFRRPSILPWLGVVLLWRAGETMVQWMWNPMLVDRGFRLEEIGVMLGVVGSIAAFVGAMAGGALVGRWGRRRTLIGFGALQAMALATYIVPALGGGGLVAIYGAIVASGLGGGLATAALYTGMMDRSASATAATDFTTQQSLAAIGPLIAAAGSGWSAATLGYAGHFGVAVAVQLAAVAYAALALRRRTTA